MSAISLATLGVQCGSAKAMATLGVICEQIDVGGGGPDGEFTAPYDEYVKQRKREIAREYKEALREISRKEQEERQEAVQEAKLIGGHVHVPFIPSANVDKEQIRLLSTEPELLKEKAREHALRRLMELEDEVALFMMTLEFLDD